MPGTDDTEGADGFKRASMVLCRNFTRPDGSRTMSINPSRPQRQSCCRVMPASGQRSTTCRADISGSLRLKSDVSFVMLVV